jgi:hypothetical protein
MHGNYLAILHWGTPNYDVVYSRLSREERKTYLDEADRFYGDPEGFLRNIKTLPQRMVFFDSLTPKLELIRDQYWEVCRLKFQANFSVRDSLIQSFMMTGGGVGMLSFGVCGRIN